MLSEAACSLRAVRRPTRMRPATAPIAIAAALILVPLAGCGEKDEPATTGPVVAQSTAPTGATTSTTTSTNGGGDSVTDEQRAGAAARSFLTSTDAAAVCDNGITAELLKSAYGDRAGCIAARKPQSLAKTADLGPVQISGGSATLSAKATGGVYGNGEKLKLTLVRDGTGAWRVSKASSNAPVGP